MSRLEKLLELRAAIDGVDRQMHDLLRARADIVHKVRAVKGKQTIFIRPGREATMLRALLERKQGRIPPGLITSLWRSMIGAFTMQEGALRIAVTAGTGAHDLWDLTRDYYGSVTPLLPCATPEQALKAAAAGRVALAVVPLPRARDARPWWRILARYPDLRVFARLPFDLNDLGRSNGRGNKTGALVLARLDPEPTGDDHTMFLARVRNRKQAAQIRAALQKDLKPVAIAGDPGQEYWLVTVRGFMGQGADILQAQQDRGRYPGVTLHWCGGYAVPLGLKSRLGRK
ncbi:MAG: chorismate mutase [Alphaproteobacteria bacterium]